MNYKNISIYLYSLLIILIIVYRNSIIPGSNSLIGKENIVIVSLFGLTMLVNMNIKEILNFNVLLVNKDNKLIVFAFIILFLSTVVYNIQELTKISLLIRFVSFVVLFITYFILLPRFVIYRPEYFNRIIRIFSVFAFALSLYGLLAYLGGFNPQGTFHSFVHSVIRHPNYASPIFVIGAMCAAYYYISNKENLGNASRMFYIFSFIIDVLAIFLSFSRNSIFAVLIFCSLFSLFVFRKKVVLYLPVFLVSLPYFALSFVTAKGFGSMVSRFLLLIPAYEMMVSSKTRLIWGYGVTNTFKVYSDYMVLYDVVENDIQNPHNAFVSAVLMFGIIFVFILTLFYVHMLFKGALISFKSKIRKEQLYIGFLVSAIGACFALGIFESQLVMTEYNIIHPFLFFSGLLFASIKSKIFISSDKSESACDK